MTDLLTDLNEAQKTAVTHGEGPLLIVAGAGTGKTSVLTRRIAWLMETGKAKSSEILALTFTEKAAGEMEERVDQLLPLGHFDLSIHTFHAFCERLLREYGPEIGLSKDFTVASELDTWLLARRYFDRFALTHYRPLGNPTRHLRDLLTHFASAKELEISPAQYRARVEAETEIEDHERARLLELADAYATYDTLLHEANLLDFGGLVLHTLRLLRERPSIERALQRRYRYVLVDEFQDTNSAQYELVRRLSAPERNLTVVGDDDQSIYRFRGASLANILQFSEDYPDATRVVLTINYRSLQEVLNRTHTFIQGNNPHRLESREGLVKKLTAHRGEGGHVEHLHATTLEEEARSVATRILAEREGDPTLLWKDIAVLVRANDHATPFLQIFESQQMPYQFLAMRGLYTKPVIMDLLALLRLVNDPFDSVSAYRVLSHPMFGLPIQDLERLSYATRKQGKPMLHLNLARIEDLSEKAPVVLQRVMTLQAKFAESARTKRATELLVESARESGLVTFLQTRPEGEQRELFGYLQQFFERVKRFEASNEEQTLRAFLEEHEQERDAGEEGSLAFDHEAGPDTIRVMTVHGSKGLEFRQVFVVNLVDQRFPSQNRSQAIPLPDMFTGEEEDAKETHLQEERRLLYVAMTRAKDKVYLTSAEDYGGKRKKKPSRFFQELGVDVLSPIESSTIPRSIFEEETPPPLADQQVTYVLPKQFSFTQYEAYLTCPLQYRFAHILRLPTIGKYQMSYGTSMHTALEAFTQQWVAQGKPPTLEHLLQCYKDAWIDDWYPDDMVRETYREEGRQSLLQFYERLQTETSTPIAVEQPFTVRVGSVMIKGKMDRVDETEKGLCIIDYKTGNPKSLKDLRRDQKEQLYIYQLAGQEIWQRPIVSLCYYYLRDNTTASFLGTQKDLDQLREGIQSVVERLAQGIFEPTPGIHCQFCDFADICEFRET